MRDVRLRLEDIFDSIEKIEKYSVKGRDVFDQNELIQGWIVLHLQRIGEAVAKLGREFHEKYSGVPWKEIVGMRNVIIHEYFDLDYDKIWDAASKHILVLKELIETLLAPPEK